MLVKFNYVVVSLLIAAFSFSALAQDKKKTAEKPAAEVKAEAPKTTEEDEGDKLITNRRLRADMGSTSNWSVRTFWSYSGGSLEKPFTADRPNIDAGADNLTLANASGDVGIRYRMTKVDSLNLNIGLNMTAPFHTSFKSSNARLQDNFDRNKQKMTANNPSLTYNHIASIMGIQSSTSFQVMYITNAQLEDTYRTYGSASQTLMKDLGNGFSIGSSFVYAGYTYAPGFNGTTLDRTFGVYPQAEYTFNDTFMWRTVFRTWVYDRVEGVNKPWTYDKRKVTQSTGIGISISRDVFLYPNIQFVPSDMRSDRTNVGITANINLF